MTHQDSLGRERGYVLLIVLAAVAVLSVVAAFVHAESEGQLVMTSSLKGQSIASSRATLAAEAYLAQYKSNYPTATLALLPSFNSYADAVDGALGPRFRTRSSTIRRAAGNVPGGRRTPARLGLQWRHPMVRGRLEA